MRRHWNSRIALIVPSPALTVPLPIYWFSNKLAPNVPNNIPVFLIVLLAPFINKRDYSRDLTIFMISVISSLEIINFVVPDPSIFLWIAASVADAGSVNPNRNRAILDSGLSTFSIKGNLFYSNGLKNVPKNP